MKNEILEYIKSSNDAGKKITYQEIADKMNKSYYYVYMTVKELENDGLILWPRKCKNKLNKIEEYVLNEGQGKKISEIANIFRTSCNRVKYNLETCHIVYETKVFYKKIK